MTIADEFSTIYVRVSPADKRALRALADREFGGSMASAVRHLILSHVAAVTGAGARPPKIFRNGESFLDED